MKKHEQEAAIAEYEAMRDFRPARTGEVTHGAGSSPSGSSLGALAARPACPIGLSAFSLPPPPRLVAAASLRRSGEGAAESPAATPLSHTSGAPKMPTKSPQVGGRPHTSHIRDPDALWNVLVARPVTRKDVLSNLAAKEAVMREWNKLRM